MHSLCPYSWVKTCTENGHFSFHNCPGKHNFVADRNRLVRQLEIDDKFCLKFMHKSVFKVSRTPVVNPEAAGGQTLPSFHESKKAVNCGKLRAIMTTHLAKQHFFPHTLFTRQACAVMYTMTFLLRKN